MDWNRAIERNREALKRVLASLVAMAGLVGVTSPLAGDDGSARQGKAEALAELGEGGFSGAGRTLPRHLHRAVLRLLRPAESAARRLVIVAARGLVVELPPPRPRKPDPKAGHAALRGLGIAVVMSPADLARVAAAKRADMRAGRAGRSPVLPLFDPPQYPLRARSRTVPPHSAPRILSFDGARPHRLPPPPSPRDPIDASRLALRLEALAAALDDLPKHARRFARWKIRRDAAGAQNKQSRERGLVRRVSPLRPGRPPGGRSARSRRPAHEVHETLGDLQYFALEALRHPDTS